MRGLQQHKISGGGGEGGIERLIHVPTSLQVIAGTAGTAYIFQQLCHLIRPKCIDIKGK